MHMDTRGKSCVSFVLLRGGLCTAPALSYVATGRDIPWPFCIHVLFGVARDLKISVITATRAYSDLEEEGFVVNVQGKG